VAANAQGLWGPGILSVVPIRSKDGNGRGMLADMASDGPPSSDNEPRVVNFRRGPGGARQPVPSPPPVADLAKYERDEGTDDYRHRMIVNVVAFVFVIGLIGAGLWLADTMAQMRKNQDCVLSGRRGCTPVEAPKDRW
jgi:hypothetical protein